MEYILAAAFFALGAVCASFVGVLAERVNTGESWVHGRSRCNSCAVPLAVQDLIPVISWCSYFGRTRCCGARLPYSYVVGELALGALFLLAFLQLGLTAALPLFFLFSATLMFIVLYDLRHTLVPNTALYVLLALGLLFALVVSPSVSAFGLTLLWAGILGLIFFLFHALSGGRLMGLADSPIVLALALLVGSSAAVPGVLFSFWIGAVVGIAVLVRRPKGHRMGIEVPFVPFLAAGYMLAFFTQWNPLVITL